MKFLNNLDLQSNELQNAVIQNYAGSPNGNLSGVVGQIVFSTTTGSLWICTATGTTWSQLATGASAVSSVSAGTAITVTGSSTAPTVNHADTSNAANLVVSSRTYVDGLTFDDHGHVTAYTTSTETVTNTDTTYDLSVQAGANNTSVIRLTDSQGVVNNIKLKEGSNITLTEDLANDVIEIAASYTDTNDIDYINFAEFSSGTLTLSGVGNAGASVSLDGRYLQSYTETDTLDSVTDRGDSTTNTITVGGIVVNGDMTVSGNHTVTLAEEVKVEDSVFVLNHGFTGSPSEDAGLIVNRGSSTNVGLIWDEGNDSWSFILTNESGDDSDVSYSVFTDVNAGNLSLSGGAGMMGQLIVGTVNSVSADQDKWLQVANDGTVVYRTTSQLLSDIGAGTGSMDDFTITDGATSTTVSNGDTITVTGTGLIDVTNVGGTFTVSTTANKYTLPQATDTSLGGVEIAANNEAITGTDSSKVITPASLKAVYDSYSYKKNIGDGSTTLFTIEHGLNSDDVMVEIFDRITKETVYADVTRSSVNEIKVEFGLVPSTNQFRVLIREI